VFTVTGPLVPVSVASALTTVVSIVRSNRPGSDAGLSDFVTSIVPVCRVLVIVHTHTSPLATGTDAGPALDTVTGLARFESSTQLIEDV
jgi:hypothetical protein